MWVRTQTNPRRLVNLAHFLDVELRGSRNSWVIAGHEARPADADHSSSPIQRVRASVGDELAHAGWEGEGQALLEALIVALRRGDYLFDLNSDGARPLHLSSRASGGSGGSASS